MKAIMYHYVRPAPADLPYAKYLHFDDFCSQLDHFQSHYGFVSHEEFIGALKAKHPLPTNKVVLTFDDGLKDHHRYVLPELKRRGLWGIFYVPTGPYQTGKILDVHRIHLLTGKVEASRLLDSVRQQVTNDMLTDVSRAEFHNLTYQKQANSEQVNLIKRTLNYFIDYRWREQVIDQLMQEFIPADLSDVANYYMTPDELGVMQSAGMVIGSHSITHPVFSKLSPEQQRHEIFSSYDFLERSTGGLPYRTFCYPYGGFHSFNANTVRLLDESRSLFSFNVESRDISVSDLAGLQTLPRYNCNEFPYGQVRD